MKQQYVGLDVSLEQTSICVIDDAGAIVWRGKCRSTPESIHAVIAKQAPKAARIGLETGQLSTWLFHELRARQLPVICIDARHAYRGQLRGCSGSRRNDSGRCPPWCRYS